MKLHSIVLVALGLAAAGTVSVAQPVQPSWNSRDNPPPYTYAEPPGMHDPREGKIMVQTFLANSPTTVRLGHGPIMLAPEAAGPTAPTEDGFFEPAIADQLARAGYQIGAAGTGQTISFETSHDVVEPPEPPHSPVHGGIGMGIGNRGSGVGLGIAIDLSKPLGALIATRIEARISDSMTHELLWQGRAEVMSRENDKHWRPDLLAGRLSAALFKNFPRSTGR